MPHPSADFSYRRLAMPVFMLFAAFGSFWGTWGAAVPRIRELTGVNDAQLGVALLFVGAGALPAMLLSGRAADRWGARAAGVVLLGLGLSGLGVAALSRNWLGLCLGLVCVGATSGAADVALNALAGRAEQQAGRPIITRAHGVFSSAVVLSSLWTGALSGWAVPLTVSFGLVAAACLLAAGLAAWWSSAAESAPADAGDGPGTGLRRPLLLLIGLLGALAFASENAHQSWSAVFLEDELRSGAGWSALAPAIFASLVAVTRFAIGGLRPAQASGVLRAGAAAAAGGTLILALSSSLGVAAAGLALAGMGTAVLFPTLIGVVSSRVPQAQRGRAISLVTVVAYLGFLLGPVYVGLLASATDLRGAMLGVAGLALVLLFLTPAVLGRMNRAEPEA